MKTYRYVGPINEVEVPVLGVMVTNGDTVDVNDPAIADSFEDQDVWEHVPDPERSAAARKAAVTRKAREAEQEQERAEQVSGVLVTDAPLAGTGDAINAETGEVTPAGEPLPVIKSDDPDAVVLPWAGDVTGADAADETDTTTEGA